MSIESRALARTIYTETISACSVEAGVRKHVQVEDGSLLIPGTSLNLRAFAEVMIIAIGKAGATMYDEVRLLLPPDLHVRALVDAPVPPKASSGAVQYFAGGHPLPTNSSFAAASAALELLNTCSKRSLVLFLISGGASAMFEAPIHPSLMLNDLIEVNCGLIGSGMNIRQMNTVRKRLSAVKGGRLAVAAGDATKLTLLISDVPRDSLDSLASGPTLPDRSTNEECRELLRTRLDLSRFSAAVQRALGSEMVETAKANHPAFQNAAPTVLFDSDLMLAETARVCRNFGLEPVIDNTCDDWPYEDAARYLHDRFVKLHAQYVRSCLLSAGEVTVRLTNSHGTGGRNQQWALEASRLLAQSNVKATVLSAGSDGIDGNSPAAGAVADSTTWKRAESNLLRPLERLRKFDTFPLFNALGDAIITGLSGTNLRDLRIFLPDNQAWSAPRVQGG